MFSKYFEKKHSFWDSKQQNFHKHSTVLRKSFLTNSQKLGYRSLSATFGHHPSNYQSNKYNQNKYNQNKYQFVSSILGTKNICNNQPLNCLNYNNLNRFCNKQSSNILKSSKLQKPKLKIESSYTNVQNEIQIGELKNLIHSLNNQNFQLKELNKKQNVVIELLKKEISILNSKMLQKEQQLKVSQDIWSINDRPQSQTESGKVVYFLSQINKHRNQQIDQMDELLIG